MPPEWRTPQESRGLKCNVLLIPFQFATSHTVSTWTRQGNTHTHTESPVTEQIENNFPTRVASYGSEAVVIAVSEISMRRDMQWDYTREKHSVYNSGLQTAANSQLGLKSAHGVLIV